MFNTIRSKIFIIVGLTLIALVAALSVFSFIYFQNSRQILIDAFYHSVAIKMQNINRDIMKLEDNARDMALFGEFFYQAKNDKSVLNKFVLKIIGDYGESLSGGIWYKPYYIDANKERYCSFAYVSDNKVILDSEYETADKSYLNQNWYKEIISQLSPTQKIAWSSPYYENIGVKAFMVTAGVGIYNKGELIGISTADWEIGSIMEDVSLVKPTSNSFVLFADVKNDFILVSTDNYLKNDEIFGKSLSNIPWYSSQMKNTTSFIYQGKKYIPYIKYMDNGMLFVVNIPENELYSTIIYRFVGLFLILTLFSMILCFFLYFELKNSIIKPIDKLSELAKKIGKGETDAAIKIENPVEFAQLAQTFDKMTKDIKSITEKQVTIDSELSIARSIQIASLPNIFPPYPNRTEFDIYASMTPAKEVGGDFYDFYFLDADHLMFLIADVSGKGVPAALFMMTVKTLISNMYQVQYSPKDVIEAINKKICENNKEGFFVTLFACIVDINTGEMSCINCGHNLPLLKHSNSEYEYLDLPSNIVLGAFPNSQYNIFQTCLNPGDRIFLYTDGVTESLNKNGEMFGEMKLKSSLNSNLDLSLEETIKTVKKEVKDYSAETTQFDDITMLIFEYKGSSDTKIFKDTAIKENYKNFYPMLYSAAAAWKLDEQLANRIYMCAEEIYANVIFYAYPEQPGMLEIELHNGSDEITLTFKDEGIEYNPLKKQDPDITLPPEKRKLGGLGIFMVKQMADNISYERLDNKNFLTLKFKKNNK